MGRDEGGTRERGRKDPFEAGTIGWLRVENWGWAQKGKGAPKHDQGRGWGAERPGRVWQASRAKEVRGGSQARRNRDWSASREDREGAGAAYAAHP